MQSDDILAIGITGFIILLIVSLRLISACYPRIIAWRAARKSKRTGMRQVELKKRQRQQDKRILAWARRNYNTEPVAKFILSADLTSRVKDKLTDEEQPKDATLAELELNQQAADKALALSQFYQAECGRYTEEIFRFVLDNPESPEAASHLEKCLDRTLDDLEVVLDRLTFEEHFLASCPESSTKSHYSAVRMAEYVARRCELGERVMLIHEALERRPKEQ